VCNAAESLLVHRAVAEAFLPGGSGTGRGRTGRDERARALVPDMAVAADKDFATEFLDLKLSVAVVDGLDGAIDHIARYGSGHTEAS